MTLQEFEQRMCDLLVEEETKKYIAQDPLHNGLMTQRHGDVSRVGFGVSDSLSLSQLAVEQQCDVIVVHHSTAPGNTQALNRFAYDRLAFLIKHDIALWSAHYTLDAHSTLGNNAQMLDAIGAQKSERTFFEMEKHGAPWGWIGTYEEPVRLDTIVQSLTGRLSPAAIVYDFGPEQIQRVAAVSGKGAPDMQMMTALVDAEIDLYITGELHEWNQELAREAAIHMIGGGHYATETFGVQALMKEVEAWGLETCFLDVPNVV